MFACKLLLGFGFRLTNFIVNLVRKVSLLKTYLAPRNSGWEVFIKKRDVNNPTLCVKPRTLCVNCQTSVKCVTLEIPKHYHSSNCLIWFWGFRVPNCSCYVWGNHFLLFCISSIWIRRIQFNFGLFNVTRIAATWNILITTEHKGPCQLFVYWISFSFKEMRGAYWRHVAMETLQITCPC
jgi:hypothetical protein